MKKQWIIAFLKDEGYDYKERKIIRVKSVNLEGLKDIQSLLGSLGIYSWITGKNCDNTWYLNIKKVL